MKYISCAETAKFVRKALKEAFPTGKFSVRSQTYSGGSSIHISWTDGLSDSQIRLICGCFEGSSFDSYTDVNSNFKVTQLDS